MLLLDEPTSALDADATGAIEETLLELRERLEIDVVWVTHDLAQARRVSDWLVRIDAGRARRRGPHRRAARGGGGAMSGVEARDAVGIDVTLGEVAASLVLVALAIGGLALAADRARERDRRRGRPLGRSS